MAGHVSQTPLCHTLLLLFLVVFIVGQVSGIPRIIRKPDKNDSLMENDEHNVTAVKETNTTTTAEETNTVAEETNTVAEEIQDKEPATRDGRDAGSSSHSHPHGDSSHSQPHGGSSHSHSHGGSSHSHSHGGNSHSHSHGGGSHSNTHGHSSHSHTEILCPSQYQGVKYQCLLHSICEPEDVWQEATCKGGPLQVCCRIDSGSSGYKNLRHKHVDYYNLPRNLMHQLFKPEALNMISTYSRKMRCGEKSHFKSHKCHLRGRISSGSGNAETCFGEWPWHVAILEKKRHKCSKPTLSEHDRWRLHCHVVHPVDLYRYICGGSLISANHVITAAHCVRGVYQNRLKLHLGDYNLYSYAHELLPELQRSVVGAYIHEGYDPYTYEDDLAILTLDHAVDFRYTPHVGPVCLPAPHHDFTENPHCTIVGWGEDPYKPNHGSNLLKAVHVTIGTEEECEERLGHSYTLGRHQLCVIGNLGSDACLGDGGGAVVCAVKADADYGNHYHGSSNAQDQYFMAGIISWGSESCGENSTTVVSLISPYLKWIRIKTSPPHHGYTNACHSNPYHQKVGTSGYGALVGHTMSLDDIKCVFGEHYTAHPSYKVWYNSVYGTAHGTVHGHESTPVASKLCQENHFFQKFKASGYGVTTGTHLSLEDIKCIFGEHFITNPNYKVWFDSTQGKNANTGHNTTEGQGKGVEVHSGATEVCKKNDFVQKVEGSGYGAISGIKMSLEDIKCVFGEDFTANPNYNQYFVSVYCIPQDGIQIPDVCCEGHNFNPVTCCGLGKLNPPKLCQDLHAGKSTPEVPPAPKI